MTRKRAKHSVPRAPLIVVSIGSLVLLASTVSTVWTGQQSSIHTVATVSNGGSVCAKQPNVLMSPPMISPTMTTISTLSQAHPFTTGIQVGSQPLPAVAPYTWFQDLNAVTPGLPLGFGPYNASQLVTTRPYTIFQDVETIQSFSSSSAAATFANEFKTQTQMPQVSVGGHLQTVGRGVQPVAGLGGNGFAVSTLLPSANIPTQVQFVVQRGNTVITLGLIGGSGVTVSRESHLIQAAIAQAVRVCPSFGT